MGTLKARRRFAGKMVWAAAVGKENLDSIVFVGYHRVAVVEDV